mmetsp:Transcript_118963/g.237125  ORF Transcript_118963/g.237125 Transcript_118963/m.237125 type:complete len:518 (+) Transcript_118963:86-1639(+)
MLFLGAMAAMVFAREAQGIPLRQEIMRSKHGVSTSLGNEKSAYPEMWYEDQRLDHFNAEDKRTFKQRFFANFGHFKPGGPIFINIGGEGPLDGKEVSGYLTNALFANQTNGATVALEHRFYGKSQPFNSLATEHLTYLTSRQALHDLARFQQWLIANRSLSTSIFFCMGGSYPGSLAAWYRLEFPEMTAGCWSSSAPVQAQETWPGFGEMVWQAVATDSTGAVDYSVSTKLYAGYEQVAGLIQDATLESFKQLEELFHVCPGTLASQQDRDSFESTISTVVGTVMQYNNTKEPKLSAVRDIVIKAKTPLDAALDVSKFLGLMDVAGLPNNCTDNSVMSLYKVLGNITLDADGEGLGNAGRTWTWQTCNEFGYFQTATSVFGKATMYTRGASSRSMWEQMCEQVFGIEATSVSARIAHTNKYYGAKDPKGISQVFFTNGALDAWSLLGVTEYPSNSREVYAEVAPLGSHCVGLYAPREGEVPGATAIRTRALQLFQRWGRMMQENGGEVIHTADRFIV